MLTDSLGSYNLLSTGYAPSCHARHSSRDGPDWATGEKRKDKCTEKLGLGGLSSLTENHSAPEIRCVYDKQLNKKEVVVYSLTGR